MPLMSELVELSARLIADEAQPRRLAPWRNRWAVVMGLKIVSLKVDEERLVASLRQLGADLKGAEEVILDFSPVRRVNRAALDALTDFVDTADEKTVNVVLSGVSVDVYRVLKLARLTQRFSMAS